MFTQKKFSIFTFGSRTKLLDVWMIVHKEGMLLMTASYRPSSFWCSFFVGSSLRWTSDVASKCRYYISALHWWLVVDPGFIWPSLLSSNSMNSAVLPCSSAALEWSNRKAPICLLVRFIASQTLSLLPKWKWSINSCLYKTNHAVASYPELSGLFDSGTWNLSTMTCITSEWWEMRTVVIAKWCHGRHGVWERTSTLKILLKQNENPNKKSTCCRNYCLSMSIVRNKKIRRTADEPS